MQSIVTMHQYGSDVKAVSNTVTPGLHVTIFLIRKTGDFDDSNLSYSIDFSSAVEVSLERSSGSIHSRCLCRVFQALKCRTYRKTTRWFVLVNRHDDAQCRPPNVYSFGYFLVALGGYQDVFELSNVVLPYNIFL
ncbi:uncharacterized protein BDR25DRAFT_356705 [Lindgomyces ingoldianus]|uniref:Uncharacterized protein n=1 Tax=Lindgomyces ingoldianus TaxID=673940 RepID=A0ACB6QTQ8_9PLEO|nr:uncharacterized protein BDR25DRAFT_356705 [Lindgomyces ingoldianus]KAF2469477.1 hypothetical protein BDR25DRAFT_356705 [Lindgomyces ingoldianus]